MMSISYSLKRYRVFILLLLLNVMLLIFLPETGKKSVMLTRDNLYEMLMFLPPIFVLLGLLDVWVEKETMTKFMGQGSGIKGVLLAFFMGSAAAGPLYAAFPVVGVMLKKGASFYNVFIFIGAWATTKIPLLLFEASSLGFKFTVLRFILNFGGIFAIAFIMEKSTSQEDKDYIYNVAEKR